MSMFGSTYAIPPLPWCALCLDVLVIDPGDYSCPFCPTEKPCRPESGHAHRWQPRDETLARLHGRNAA